MALKKTSFEKADFALRLLTFVALVAGGAWAAYQYKLTGADDWTNNMTVDAKVLPYHDDLRLLVVHVRSKNPRNTTFELESKSHDSYSLTVRKIAADAKVGTVFHEDAGDVIAKVDLLDEASGDYEFLPGAEMDDMQTIVLPAGITVVLTADMEIHNGTTDENGKPDSDSISVSTVARVEP
ncbi:hypothetical protein [Paraburkholderia dipogonis]|uniref:hypothetical protein n=1 Tax=Paraburkholderia dipogonis TaxID=1211383 RepID=UPI0038B788EC